MSHILSIDRLRAFFKENDFDSFGQLIKDYLDHRIQRHEVQETIQRFRSCLRNAGWDMTKELSGLKLFSGEFKSQSALIDYEPGQAFSGAYRNFRLWALASTLLSTHSYNFTASALIHFEPF